ncbi:MAG: hypothetical protein HON76_04980 [Candidatus Scalindua sp.]|jgi:predicted transcriptional regulator|nr:hypothetical protein [Candidatus Scalindua sp.]MBT6226491.1 hypothetical protein [Candidatus Scalindua sp.]MBT6561864.1 hypothetical protein [Candidatus Scalindua sp.]MBT7210107.1 hypothetical protein [Candidatus Scalindua sp.]MBT7592396.1 hypothetical protein [Candidatus Scalindua sp.]
MSVKNNINTNKSGIAISHLELDNKISRIIFEKWPKFVTQKEIAKELNVSQSLVSKRLSSWTNKKNVPLKMSYEERNVELEKKLKDAYHLNDVVVLKNADYFVHTQAYYKQIGKYASDILVRKINVILEEKTKTRNNQINEKDIIEETEIKISAQGGSSVLTTIKSLADELENTDIKLLLSSCIALRSNNLIELSPLHIVSQLLSRNLNVGVTHTYQLPEITNLYSKESLYEIIEQRIRTRKMLGFENEVLTSDVVILGLGSIRWNHPVTGFMRHVYNLRLQSFLNNFDIVGEIAFAPFSKKGFLFHHLVGEVFERENGYFKYDEHEQIERLKNFATNRNITVSKQDLIDAAAFFSSIFTVNFCEIEERLQKQDKKPYILLAAGGPSQKALPLKIILDRWKGINILDGLVTSENIAQDL